MPDVPKLSRQHPTYARREKHDRIVVTFPGHGWRSWQVAAMVATVPLFAVNPAFAGLAAFLPMAWSRFLRTRSAPELRLLGDSLTVRQGGGPHTVLKSAVLGAGARREGADWVLALDTADGPIVLGDTGAPPAELQWMAELIGAWKRDEDRAPSPRAWLVADDLGEQVLAGGPPLRPVDLAATVWMGLLVVAVGVAGAWWGPGESLALHFVAATPVLAVLGHFLGSHRDGRTEVRLRAQSLHVHTTWPREHRRSIALEDIHAVEGTTHRTRLVLHSGETVDIDIKKRGSELAAAIEERRAAMATQQAGDAPDAEREARRKLEQLSRTAGVRS